MKKGYKAEIIIAVLFGIAFALGISALVVHAQEDNTETTDDGWRWRVENLITDNPLGVTAIQWNDCTGETWMLSRDNDQYTYDPTDEVLLEKIREGE